MASKGCKWGVQGEVAGTDSRGKEGGEGHGRPVGPVEGGAGVGVKLLPAGGLVMLGDGQAPALFGAKRGPEKAGCEPGCQCAGPAAGQPSLAKCIAQLGYGITHHLFNAVFWAQHPRRSL